MANKDDEIEKILSELKGSKDGGEAPQGGLADLKGGQDERPLEAYSPKPAGGVNDYADEYEEEEAGYVQKPGRKKAVIIAAIAAVAVIAAALGIYFGAFYEKEPEPAPEPKITTTTTAAPVIIRNPLTGEEDYNEAAVDKRPVAVVVENAPGARPQYNMDTPDIIVEGEVEGGITRMLWLYADMTALPDTVGPTRSARPGFVEFSQFFDSIFIHYGESHSKGDYLGADDYMDNEDVDNIDGMSTSACFRRTKDKASPHNAVLEGDELMDVINDKDYRTGIDEAAFTKFSFNEKTGAVSSAACSRITTKFSSRTDSHTFTYDSADGLYKNRSDFDQEVAFTNIIALFADTEYVDKNNYKSSGNTETYCNFKFTSGTGTLATAGTTVDFTWSADNGRLTFKKADGTELKLNPGRSWIGIISANHGGSAVVSAE